MVEEADFKKKYVGKNIRQNLGLTDKEPWWEKVQELPAFERDFYKVKFTSYSFSNTS